MYNLLLTAQEGAWDKEYFLIEKSRFLEHTDDILTEKFRVLDAPLISELCRCPSLFGYELHIEEAARIGWITKIKVFERRLGVYFEFEQSIPPIDHISLYDKQDSLDISRFEGNRTHWAIKNVNLWNALNITEIYRSKSNSKPLNLSRRTIISSVMALEQLSHSQFDSMLLEFGLPNDVANKEVGGRKARAASLSQFVLNNQNIRTVEGKPLTEEIVKYVLGFDLESDLLKSSLLGDGYIFESGVLKLLEDGSSIDAKKVYDTPSQEGSPSQFEWDVFISHASEDKDDIVRPLAKQLQSKGVRVWLDEQSLSIGDSLRESIDNGLANSRFGVVVISPSFLKKTWPNKELSGLVTRESNGVKVILPVWHNITEVELSKSVPMLADRVAISTNSGLDAVASEILNAIRQKPTSE